MTQQSQERSAGRIALHSSVIVIAVIMLLAGLKVSRPVVLPLAVSAFLAILLRPVQQAVEERMPRGLRWLGLLTALTTLLLAVALLLGMLALGGAFIEPEQFAASLNALSDLQHNLATWIENVGLPASVSPTASQGLGDRALAIAQNLAGSLTHTLTQAGLIFFLTLLILVEWHEWQRKAVRLGGRQAAGDVLDRIANQVRRYLLVRTATSAISAFAWFVYLWATGVELAYVWALLAFVLNYIPNIGSILAVIPPSLMALVQFDPLPALAIIGGLVVVEQFIGSYLDPRMQGSALSISTVVIVGAVIFWGWMWGVVGAVLAVPLVIVLAAFSAHTPKLGFLALILGRPQSTSEETEALREQDDEEKQQEK